MHRQRPEPVATERGELWNDAGMAGVQYTFEGMKAFLSRPPPNGGHERARV
jgi:hypothetical protein